MYLKYLFIFFSLSSISSFCQSYTVLGIKENYYTKEIRSNDEIIKNDKPLTVFKYLYSFNKTKDTVYVYKQTNSLNFDEIDQVKYILRKKSSNNTELIITDDDNSIKILNIEFNDKTKNLNINESTYFLNTAYYNYLKKNLNVSEVVNLLDDFLQEDIYQLGDLQFINSNTKYRNKNFKILKAKMQTVNSQNESLATNWQISYSYNKSNILTSLKQKTKDEVRYNKILVGNTNSRFCYKIYRQVDERFSDDKTVTFDIIENMYAEKGTYLQVGLNKEEDYETKVNRNTPRKSSSLTLSKNELEIFFKNIN